MASKPDFVNIDLGLFPELSRSDDATLFGDAFHPATPFDQYLIVEDGRWLTFHVIPGHDRPSAESFISWFTRYAEWVMACS